MLTRWGEASVGVMGWGGWWRSRRVFPWADLLCGW